MGYGYYVLDDGRKRGYAVRCKCHKRGCKEQIDRGLSYLCYRCTWYFCEEHLTMAWLSDGNTAIEAECFAGPSTQVCHKCAKEMENDPEYNFLLGIDSDAP